MNIKDVLTAVNAVRISCRFNFRRKAGLSSCHPGQIETVQQPITRLFRRGNLSRPNFLSGAPKSFATADQTHRARSPEAGSNLRKPGSEYRATDQSVKQEQLRQVRLSFCSPFILRQSSLSNSSRFSWSGTFAGFARSKTACKETLIPTTMRGGISRFCHPKC